MYIKSAGECDTCGKLKFQSEKQAILFKRKRFPKDTTMSVYRCGSYWHIGHHADKYQRYEERNGKRKRRQNQSNRARSSYPVRPQIQPVDLDALFGDNGGSNRVDHGS